MIYLDNAASTMMDERVINAMTECMRGAPANPNSKHSLGIASRARVEEARASVASLIGAAPDNIIFTSGGTEANNIAINSMCYELNGGTIAVSSVSHSSVFGAIAHHCTNGASREIPCEKDGSTSFDTVKRMLDEDNTISAVSILYVNNELGSVSDVIRIGALCKERGVKLHIDCVQAAGFYDIDVALFNCDYLSISSHKIHGPHGVGALYARNVKSIVPLVAGSLSQEFGKRGGTENVEGIVGFGEACKIALNELKCNKAMCMAAYNRLKGRLFGMCSANGIQYSCNGMELDCSRILSVTFEGIDSSTLVMLLSANGVCVSSGAACDGATSMPSHVLTASGMSHEDARSTIRISFSKYNTEEEMDSAAKIITECVLWLKEKREM